MSDDIRILTDDGFVVSNPRILGGTPCIRGTRLNVYAIAARFNGGETAAEILDGYADVPEQAVIAAVRFADDHPFGRASRCTPLEEEGHVRSSDMRFLLDECLPHQFAARMAIRGFPDTIHPIHIGMRGSGTTSWSSWPSPRIEASSQAMRGLSRIACQAGCSSGRYLAPQRRA